MSITTDPNDPDLGHGVNDGPVPQNKKYLVLSSAELSKGYTRPYRTSYIHLGQRPKHPTRDLTPDELKQYKAWNYVKYEMYPASELPLVGKYWTAAQLKNGCGAVTTMGPELSATYARDPKFYGSTYCVGCKRHLHVSEFRWTLDEELVGS